MILMLYLTRLCSSLQRYIQQHNEVELSALGMGIFSWNFLSFQDPNKKKCVFFVFVCLLFHFWIVLLSLILMEQKENTSLIESDFLVMLIMISNFLSRVIKILSLILEFDCLIIYSEVGSKCGGVNLILPIIVIFLEIFILVLQA